MARQANKLSKHTEPVIDQERLNADAAALPVLAARLTEIDEQFGDGLAYDRNRYIDKCRFHMTRSAEEALEVGRCLVVMREREAHGEWLQVLTSVGIERRLAQRMMQTALRFSNAALTPHLLEAAQTKTKLFELLVLDDEELKELDDGGTVAGLTLDDIERMPVSALRASLRDSRARVEDKDKLLAAKNAKLDELTSKKKRVKEVPPDEIHKEIMTEVTGHMHDAAGCIRGQLRQGFVTLAEHERQFDGDSRIFMAGVLDTLRKALAELAYEFGMVDTPAAGAPEWLQPGPWNPGATSDKTAAQKK